MNDGDDRKKDDQQCRERQSLLKRMTYTMLLGDAIQGGRQDNNEQTDNAWLGQVKSELSNSSSTLRTLGDSCAP